MKFEELKELIDEHIDLILLDAKALKEAQDRATRFLVVVSVLSNYRLDLEKKKTKLITLREAHFSQALGRSEAKNVTEKKMEAESDPKYTGQREAVEEIDSEISWVKCHIEIFNNAHITYRQLSKEGA